MKITPVYVPSPRISVSQRDWKQVRKYMRDGFYICERTASHVVLKKKSQIFIEIEKENGKTIKRDFRNRLAEFYGREKKGYILYVLFKEDLASGKVDVIKDPEKNIYLVINK